MLLFVIKKRDRIKLNADVKVKNLLAKEHVLKDLIGNVAFVNVNVMNYEIFKNI